MKTYEPLIYGHSTNKNIINQTLAIVGDTHYSEDTPNIKMDLVAKDIDTINPDVIVLNGDMVNDAQDTRKFYEFIKLLLEFHKKIIYSPGNHCQFTANGKVNKNPFREFEWLEHPINDILETLKNMGVITIYNENYYDKETNINYVGMSLDAAHYEPKISGDERELWWDFIIKVNNYYPNPFPEEYFNIGLSHSPENAMRKKVISKTIVMKTIDILISNHKHNGAVPYWFEPIYNKLAKAIGFENPKNRGIFAPGGGLFPDLARGTVELDKIKGFICPPVTGLNESMGIWATILNSRFVIPPRVTKLILKKED